MRKKLLAVFAMIFALSFSVAFVGCGGTSDSGSTDGSSSNEISSPDTSSGSNQEAKYTITFDANGGMDVDSQEVKEGELASAPTPTRVGYAFDGWYNGDVKFDFTTAITANMTLKAKWTPNSDTFYFVEVWVEGLDGNYAQVTDIEDMEYIRVGVTDADVDLTDEAQALMPTGYEIDNEQSILTGSIAGEGTSVFKVYVARATYQLAFEGVTGIEPLSVKYGATVAFAQLPVIPAVDNKTGYWELNGTKVTEDIVWEWAENKTLTAVYIGVPQTVTFMANGEQYDFKVVENGTVVSAPETNPEKTGYSFDGWYTEGASEAFDFTTVIGADITLTANFVAKNYTLTIDKQDGIGGEESISVTYDSAIGQLPVLTKDNYVFVNWTIGGTVVDENTVWTWLEDQTITANWKLETRKVSFVIADEEVANEEVEIGAKVAMPNVTKLGYEVTWYTDAECTTAYDFDTAVEQNNTLYGKWAVANIGFKSNSWAYHYVSGATKTAQTVFGGANDEYAITSTFAGDTALTDTNGVTALYYALDTTKEALMALKADGYVAVKMTIKMTFTPIVEGNTTVLRSMSVDGVHISSGDNATQRQLEVEMQSGVETEMWMDIQYLIDNFDKIQTVGNNQYLLCYAPQGTEYTIQMKELVPATVDELAKGMKLGRILQLVNDGKVVADSTTERDVLFQEKVCDVVYNTGAVTRNKSVNFCIAPNVSMGCFEELIAAGYTKIKVEYYSTLACHTDPVNSSQFIGGTAYSVDFNSGAWSSWTIDMQTFMDNYRATNTFVIHSYKLGATGGAQIALAGCEAVKE